MIGYVILGTNDLPRAARFYDVLLGDGGAKRLVDTDAMIAWGLNWDDAMLAITVPEDGGAATPGHGGLVALVQKSRAKVDTLHAKALTLGATNDGTPTLRGAEADQGFYAGYCRDPDGNRLCLFYLGARS